MADVFEQTGATGGALFARGMVAYSKGELESAAAQLEQAVLATPTLAEAFSGLGLVYESMGQREAAVQAYQQALHLKSDDFNATSGLARLTQSESGSAPVETPADHPGAEAGDGSEQGVTP
jgi:Flp pilus assembly protein TadD